MTQEQGFVLDVGESPSVKNPAESIGSVSHWEMARDQLLAISRLGPGWNGDGADPLRLELIRSALDLIDQLKLADDALPPMDVYPLATGEIVLEWQFANGFVQRYFVESVGSGTLMESSATSHAKFTEVRWEPIDRPLNSPVWCMGVVAQNTHLDNWPWQICDDADYSDESLFPLAA